MELNGRLRCQVSGKEKVDQVLNIVGLLQPQSLFLIRKTLERVKCGGILEIVSDKSKSMDIIAGLCPKKKYRLIARKETRGLFHYTIMKN